MTKTTSHLIGCALTLAALFTTGCHVQIGTTPGTGVKPPVTANSATGTVKVAFQGLGGYKTLATRYDIHRVELTLQPARGKSQVRQVKLHELQQGSVGLDFKKVSTGQAQLNVVAYDANGAVIGKGYSSAHVSANADTFMHVAVKLNPDSGSGNVHALITFEDGLAEDEIFYQSDWNGNGHLELDEFRDAYHRAPWPLETPAYPVAPPVCAVPTPMPVLHDKLVAPAIAPCPMPPVLDPIAFAFDQKDWNGDRRLSLDEFLGRMYAMPVAAADAE